MAATRAGSGIKGARTTKPSVAKRAPSKKATVAKRAQTPTATTKATVAKRAQTPTTTTKAPIATVKTQGGALEGVALVEAIIAVVQKQGFGGTFTAWQKRLQPKKPVPMAAPALAKLSLGKQPLPPSLARWLSFHSTFQGVDFAEVEWLGTPWPDLLDEAIGPMARFLFEDTNPPVEGPAVKLETFSDYEVHAILAGTPDSIGEQPIVQVYANQPGHSSIEVHQPGFDAYLASWLQPAIARTLGIDLESRPFAQRLKHHVATNFGGKRSYRLGR